MFYLIFLFFCCFGCNDPKPSPTETETAVVEWTPPWSECENSIGNHPCDWTLVDQSGDERSLYEFYGRPIVLDLSAMWCYPCNVAAFDAQEIQDLYASEDLVYLTVLIENRTGSPPELIDIQSWVSDYNITTAPVLAGSRELLNNSDPKLGYYLEGWPTFYFINNEMVMKSYLKGYSREMLEAEIDIMLLGLE